MLEQLTTIKDQLISQVQGQMNNLQNVDAKELGEVIDMIKDLSEAAYYCTVTQAMEDHKEKENNNTNSYYYTEKYYPVEQRFHNGSSSEEMYHRGMDMANGRMFYGDGNRSGKNDHTYYTEEDYSMNFRDSREGRSPMRRKMYMESKETNQNSTKKIKELEDYMQELTSDMIEMINGASPEEKTILKKKVTALAAKLESV